MILYFLHKNGEVKFYSNKEPIFDKLKCERLFVEKSEMDLIDKGGVKLKINNGKLIIEKSDYVKKIESKAELKEKISKAKDVEELKNLILSFI